MTFKESILVAIKSVFIHASFRSRSSEYVLETYNMKHKGSNTVGFLPPVPKIEVTTIDEQHDQWSLVYDDLTIEYIVTWRPSTVKPGQFVLENLH